MTVRSSEPGERLDEHAGSPGAVQQCGGRGAVVALLRALAAAARRAARRARPATGVPLPAAAAGQYRGTHVHLVTTGRIGHKKCDANTKCFQPVQQIPLHYCACSATESRIVYAATTGMLTSSAPQT